jgi:hypothetical protein
MWECIKESQWANLRGGNDVLEMDHVSICYQNDQMLNISII